MASYTDDYCIGCRGQARCCAPRAAAARERTPGVISAPPDTTSSRSQTSPTTAPAFPGRSTGTKRKAARPSSAGPAQSTGTKRKAARPTSAGPPAAAKKAQRRNKKIVLSADYDGCFDILTPGVETYFERTGHRKVLPRLRAILRREIELLERDVADGQQLILMVGSARQSILLDHRNREQRAARQGLGYVGNQGLCFFEYPRLAEKRGWHLDRLLLADADAGAAPGTAMTNPVLDLVKSRTDHQQKIDLLWNQITHLRGKYPGEEIDLYFFDDRADILRAVAKGMPALPPLVQLHLVRFDWFNHFEGKPVLAKWPMSSWTMDGLPNSGGGASEVEEGVGAAAEDTK